MLLVEQNFRVAREVGDWVRVMDNGRIVHAGAMAELADDAALQARLLGLSLDGAPMTASDFGAALPRPKRDFLPALTPLIVAAIAAPFIGSGSSFVTLTAAGLAMGMMIFIMASGLTLVFGLMDVLNFGHGAFISLGAYVATLAFAPLASWAQADSLAAQSRRCSRSRSSRRWSSAALFGLVFERLVIVPVYGQHLKQILVDDRRLDRRRAIALRAVRPAT